jgi:hypothetical protein
MPFFSMRIVLKADQCILVARPALVPILNEQSAFRVQINGCAGKPQVAGPFKLMRKIQIVWDCADRPCFSVASPACSRSKYFPAL